MFNSGAHLNLYVVLGRMGVRDGVERLSQRDYERGEIEARIDEEFEAK